MPAARPNVLLLVSDQHRGSALGCGGNAEVLTPNLDRMASEGVRFTQCLSSCPVCAPFRATLQTGLHAHQHGVRQNNFPWVGQHFTSLADGFNARGYETCFIGKTHWGKYLFYDRPWTGGYVPPSRRLRWKHWYSMHGHDQYDSRIYDDDGNVAEDFADQHQPTVQTNLAMERIAAFGDRPWLVQVNWGPPHTVMGKAAPETPDVFALARRVNQEYGFGFDDGFFDDPKRTIHLLLPQHLLCERMMPPEYLAKYEAERLTVDPAVPERFRKLIQCHLKEYYALITSIDDEVGRLMRFLRETGRDRDTLVVYTSDHGDRMGAHCTLEKFRTKSTWHQSSCRVPLIVWGPGAGVRVGEVNDTPVGSVDLMPTLLEVIGAPVPPHLPGESVLDTCTGHGCVRERELLLSLASWRALYDGRYLYAIQGEGDCWRPLALIDTEADPYDLNNLLDAPDHVATRERMHASLVDELIRTSDHEFVLRTHLKERHI